MAVQGPRAYGRTRFLAHVWLLGNTFNFRHDTGNFSNRRSGRTGLLLVSAWPALELDLRAQLREGTRTPKQEVLLMELGGFLQPVSGR